MGQTCPEGQMKWNLTRGEIVCYIPNAALCSTPLSQSQWHKWLLQHRLMRQELYETQLSPPAWGPIKTDTRHKQETPAAFTVKPCWPINTLKRGQCRENQRRFIVSKTEWKKLLKEVLAGKPRQQGSTNWLDLEGNVILSHNTHASHFE